MPPQKKNSQTTKATEILFFLLALCLLIVLPLFLFNDKKQELKREKTKNRDSLLREKEKIEKTINEKKSRIDELDRKFFKRYQWLRISALSIWFIVVFTLCRFYCSNFKEVIGLITDVNSLAFLLILLMNFFIFGKLTDTKELIGQSQERLKNWVYRKDLGIKDELFNYNEQLNIIESKLTSIERELAELQ